MLQVKVIMNDEGGIQVGNKHTLWDVYAQASSDDNAAVFSFCFWAIDMDGKHVGKVRVPKMMEIIAKESWNRIERANTESCMEASGEPDTKGPVAPAAVLRKRNDIDGKRRTHGNCGRIKAGANILSADGI